MRVPDNTLSYLLVFGIFLYLGVAWLMEENKCKDCGACCEGVGIPPFDAEESLQPEIEEILSRIPQAQERVNKHFGCYYRDRWLQECLIYNKRPKVCRSFQPNGELCQSMRKSGLR